MKKILSILVVVNMMILGLSTAMNQQDFTSTATTMSLSRDVDSLEENVEEADAVLKVRIGNLIDEINLDELPQTIFQAEVLEVIKGEVGNQVNILQDGVKSIPIENSPLFRKGEIYLLVLNKVDETVPYDNTYWITDEYFINGDSAVEMFPKLAEDEIDLEEQEPTDISITAQRKADALTYDAEILDLGELIEVVEEVVEDEK